MQFFQFSKKSDVAEMVEPSDSAEPGKTKPQTLNQKELARLLGGTFKLSIDVSEEIIRRLVTIVEFYLKDGHDVYLPGLGRFRAKALKRTSFRNPKTGKKVEAHGRRSVRFKPSARLKQAVNA